VRGRGSKRTFLGISLGSYRVAPRAGARIETLDPDGDVRRGCRPSCGGADRNPSPLDKEAGILLIPILALCGDAVGDSLSSLDAETDAEFLAEAPEMIPVCVFGIRDFWRERPSRSFLFRNQQKAGRNVPAPVVRV
jgi:hypothetical protein